MAGTAALPHVLMRFFTTPSVRDARWSAGWSLLFIALLYLTAPAYAAFARYVVLKDVVGKPIDQLPDWAQKWAQTGLFKVIDKNGDGIIQWAELDLHRDIVVLATPEIAGLTMLVGYFVMARALALKYKVSETNTLQRMEKLRDMGVLYEELYNNLREAFLLLQELRLKSQINKLQRGETPDNYVNPEELTKIEKDLLKDAFKVVEEFQNFVETKYLTYIPR